jgi:ABC-type sulfate transport system substrate-binding protein
MSISKMATESIVVEKAITQAVAEKYNDLLSPRGDVVGPSPRSSGKNRDLLGAAKK